MANLDVDAISSRSTSTPTRRSPRRATPRWTTTLHEASSRLLQGRGQARKPTLEEIAAYYRERKMAAVVFTVDAESATGTPPVPNEEVAEAAAANPDVLIPFASIDPFRGKAGVRRPRRLVEEYGVRGFKFHPSIQGFFPNDRSVAYGLYEAIEETGAIALFHTGQTGIGAGVPGGGRDPAEVLQPAVRRRRRRRLPRT